MDKQALRQQAYAIRNTQAGKDVASAEICRCVVNQPWYAEAETVLWYVHCRSEVRTLSAVIEQLNGRSRIAVPYCTVDEQGNRCLGLWHLEDLSELEPGMWNILEPAKTRWQEAGKYVDAKELDVIIVPGVAFDKQGGRLGNGAGYYDRLLQNVRRDAVLAGICYQSQILPQIPMVDHDVAMDFVITEQTIYRGRRNR